MISEMPCSKQVGLFVGAPPGHLQDIRDEALGQPVAADHLLGAAEPFGREADDLPRVDGDEVVARGGA